MSDRICILYDGCPLEALNRAIREHGRDKHFMLVPACLWDRLVPKKRGRRNERENLEIP